MPRKILLAAVAGGVALFVWGVVAWTLLPLYKSALKRLPGEDQVVAVLVTTGTAQGIYAIPGLPLTRQGTEEARAAAEKDWDDRVRRGPLGILVYQPEGRSPTRMTRPMLRGLSLCLLASLFSAWALSRARIGSHRGRILFVVGLGVFGWILGPGMQWSWFGYPLDYTSATLLDSLAGWVIVGIVQTGIVRAGPDVTKR